MKSDEIPEIRTVELQIPTLGKVQGLSFNNETCQYLGIPYANIPGRFLKSVPPKPWINGEHDGTKLGPYCPQPPRDFYPIPSAARPWLDMPDADEFNCLNLNISVPRLPSENGKPLPVMVFLHGGAFAYSMGSSPIYDGRILADASANVLSRPTIVITLNYRLGVYGFLAGRDLEEYNKGKGDSGVGNYGIWDQVLALRWIQKHIAGFGGDPKQVTLFGQSAGAVSVHCHLLRDEPLFSSAILQSGLIRLCGVMSIDEYQICYENILTELGISLNLPPAERVARLLEVDATRLTAAMVPVFVVPVITMALCDDNALIPGGIPTSEEYAQFKVPEWCPRIMLGDCVNECIIWNKSWDNLSPKPMAKDADLSTPTAPLLLKKMDSFLGADKSRAIADLYGLSENSSPAETFSAIERFTTHGIYCAPNYFAELACPNVYAWHFDVPSPYDNAWNGMAHHSFDNVLIWSVLRHTLPEKHQRIGDVMVEAWVKFANGEEPWERFDVKNRWMVFKENGVKMMDREEDEGRGYEIWDRLHELKLARDLADLSIELCLRTSDVLKRRANSAVPSLEKSLGDVDAEVAMKVM